MVKLELHESKRLTWRRSLHMPLRAADSEVSSTHVGAAP